MVARKQHFGTGSSRLADVVRFRASVAPPTIRIPLAQLDPSPRNPRQRLDVDGLVASIRAYGLLQPVVVRRAGARYELVAGHRRVAALQALASAEPDDARWREVEAVVRHADAGEAYLLTLAENLQRTDLSPREEAAALEVLVRQEGWSVRKVADAIHREPSYVSRRLRVFDDPALAPAVLTRQLAVSTAEELLKAAPAERASYVERAIAEQWTPHRARQQLRARCDSQHRGEEILGHLRAALAAARDPADQPLTDPQLRDARRLLTALGRVLRQAAAPPA